MDVLEAIYGRRSIRSFTSDQVERDKLLEILKAGSWAPSGLNNQPWRFVIISNTELRMAMARLTRYRHIIEEAPSLIAVFCDRTVMYHDTKDHQAVGAALQNMLLAAHAIGLGAVWLGEILKSSTEVRNLLHLPETMEFMALIAVGYPKGKGQRSKRKDIKELLLDEL
jgi:nitroreductase